MKQFHFQERWARVVLPTLSKVVGVGCLFCLTAVTCACRCPSPAFKVEARLSTISSFSYAVSTTRYSIESKSTKSEQFSDPYPHDEIPDAIPDPSPPPPRSTILTYPNAARAAGRDKCTSRAVVDARVPTPGPGRRASGPFPKTRSERRQADTAWPIRRRLPIPARTTAPLRPTKQVRRLLISGCSKTSGPTHGEATARRGKRTIIEGLLASPEFYRVFDH